MQPLKQNIYILFYVFLIDTDKGRSIDRVQDPTVCCLQELISNIKTARLKIKEWIKVYSTNTNQKKTGISILISEKNTL